MNQIQTQPYQAQIQNTQAQIQAQEKSTKDINVIKSVQIIDSLLSEGKNDEALPYVAHSEGTVARDVHERIRLGEPPCRLRVEGAPDMRAEAYGRRIVEIERTVLRQSPDGVDVR